MEPSGAPARLPDGCFFVGAATEFDDRPGAVRNAIAGYSERWQRELRNEINRAVGAGELTADPDPEQRTFELVGVMLAAHNAHRLHHDPAATGRAERALDRLLR